MKSRRASTALILLCCALPAHATTYVYLSTGDKGEPAFSDQNSATATRVMLPDTPSAPSDSAALIEQMLKVADNLAAARAVREAQREASRAPVAQPPPVIVYQERGGYYGYPGYAYPPRHKRRHMRHAGRHGDREYRGPGGGRHDPPSSRPRHSFRFNLR